MTFSAIVSFIEAIPALVKLVQTFIDKWQDYQYSKLLQQYTDKDLKRSSLIKAVKKAETDEERKALIRMLYDLNKLR
jgi:hypothetical protein